MKNYVISAIFIITLPSITNCIQEQSLCKTKYHSQKYIPTALLKDTKGFFCTGIGHSPITQEYTYTIEYWLYDYLYREQASISQLLFNDSTMITCTLDNEEWKTDLLKDGWINIIIKNKSPQLIVYAKDKMTYDSFALYCDYLYVRLKNHMSFFRKNCNSQLSIDMIDRECSVFFDNMKTAL